jgi:hypothetical protein
MIMLSADAASVSFPTLVAVTFVVADAAEVAVLSRARSAHENREAEQYDDDAWAGKYEHGEARAKNGETDECHDESTGVARDPSQLIGDRVQTKGHVHNLSEHAVTK